MPRIMDDQKWTTASVEQKLDLLRSDLIDIANAQNRLSRLAGNLLILAIRSPGVSEDVRQVLTRALLQTSDSAAPEAAPNAGQAADENAC